MNRRGESLYLPNNLAVQRARKLGYNKEWNDMRILNDGIMRDAQIGSRTYRGFIWNRARKLSEAGEKIE